MDARPEPGLVKWSSNPALDAFLHVNILHRVVSLYEPSAPSETSKFPFRRTSKHEEIPILTTYDWSPTVPGLVAIGIRGGLVNLVRVDDGSNAFLELVPRFHRNCHAVAFNTVGKLAVGLDRVRNDQCLYLWDVDRLSNLDPAVPGFPDTHFAEPLHRLEPSVSVSSIKFFEDNPNTLVVGIKAQGLRIHDLRGEPDAPALGAHQLTLTDPGGAVATFQTKCNNNIAIDYADQNYFASSPLDQPSVMIWDRRAGSRTEVSSDSAIPTQVYQEAVEAGDVPWGSALQMHQMLEPSEIPDKSAFIRSLRYCRDHAGMLGILSRTGQLKVVTTTREFECETGPELLRVRKSHEMDPTYLEPGRKNRDDIVSFDWARLGSPALRPRMLVLRASGKFEIMEKPMFSAPHLSSMIPWAGPQRGLEGHERYHSLLSFEEPHHLDMLGPLLVENAMAGQLVFGGNETNHNAMLLKKTLRFSAKASDQDQIIDNMAASKSWHKQSVDSPAPVAEKLRYLRVHGSNGPAPIQNRHAHPHASIHEVSALNTPGGPSSSCEVHDHLIEMTTNTVGLSKEGQCTVDHILYQRAKEGYLFDFCHNEKVVAEDPWLQNLWEWLSSAEAAAANGGMIAHPLILDYVGVYNIWMNDLGVRSSLRLIDCNMDPDALVWERCLGQIAKRQRLPRFDGAQTKWPHHRQVCLLMCEWGQPTIYDDDFASRTKATAQALFKGDSEAAIQILKEASSEHPTLLFVSLALQLMERGDIGMAKEQLDFDERVASKTDPYLRAISSLIATGDWNTIVHQNALPLRDRVFVAVRQFSDEDLSEWLIEQVSQGVDNGDIEGILLHGVSDRMVDVFCKYVEKFNDFQTATIVMSICAPRFIDDHRCQAWRNAYRRYLQRHRAFYWRAKFEVESTKKSRRDGRPVIKLPYRQIALRCTYCDAEVALHGQHVVGPGLAERNPLMATSVNAGVSCWSCGRHLPRCVVCLEVIGISRSDRPEPVRGGEAQLDGKFPTFCLRCEHVLHLDHAREWFARHVECPVPECRCRCNFRANPELNYQYPTRTTTTSTGQP